MSDKLGKKDMVNSLAAINAYMDYKEENGYRHKARVLVSFKGKTRYNNVLYVAIDARDFYLIVEGDNEFASNFHGRYGHKHNRFSIIHGTLIIKATDIWGNAIEINVSSI